MGCASSVSKRVAPAPAPAAAVESALTSTLRGLAPLLEAAGEGRVMDENGFWGCGGGTMEEATRASRAEAVLTRAWEQALAGDPRLERLPRDTLEEYALAGVPPSLRGRVWSSLLRADRAREANPPGTYERLAGASVPEAAAKQIDADLGRTYPGHAYLCEGCEGVRALRRLLRALSLACPRPGYVQGMNFVAALFLLQASGDEEGAFWMAVAFMYRLGWVACYGSAGGGMERLLRSMGELDALLAARVPGVRSHLDRAGVEVAMFASPWFLTCFTYNLPPPAVMRVWDVMVLASAREAGVAATEQPDEEGPLALGALGPAVRGDLFVLRFALAFAEKVDRDGALEDADMEGALHVMSLRHMAGLGQDELRHELRRICTRALEIRI